MIGRRKKYLLYKHHRTECIPNAHSLFDNMQILKAKTLQRQDVRRRQLHINSKNVAEACRKKKQSPFHFQTFHTATKKHKPQTQHVHIHHE